MTTWPDDFEARRAGVGCPMCESNASSSDGSDSDVRPHGVRFMVGTTADAFLGRHPVRHGYAYVVWKGRHVAEPTELDADEAAAFWTDVARAARAIAARYRPVKMNWLALGNGVPHLHVHLVPRHDDDPAAGGPIEPAAFDSSRVAPLTDDELTAEVSALRALVS